MDELRRSSGNPSAVISVGLEGNVINLTFPNQITMDVYDKVKEAMEKILKEEGY